MRVRKSYVDPSIKFSSNLSDFVRDIQNELCDHGPLFGCSFKDMDIVSGKRCRLQSTKFVLNVRCVDLKSLLKQIIMKVRKE